MWMQVTMTGLAAILAGGLVVPAAQRLFLGDVEQDWVAGELELDGIDDDGQTVHLKNGAMFRAFQLQGTSYDAKVLEQQENMLKGRSALFHQIGSLGLPYWLFGIKRKRSIAFAANWPAPALKEIGDAERQTFQASYYIDWYLVIGSTNRRVLNDGCGKVRAMGGDYKPRAVLRSKEPDQGCELTGFLNYLVSGELRYDLPAISRSLSRSLPAADLSISREGLIETYTPSRRLHRIVAIREWPEEISGHLLADIMALKGDLEINQICEPWDRDEAVLLFSRKKKEQQSSLVGNPELAAECEATIQLLTQGNTTLFHTQLQIAIRATEEEDLDRLVGEVCEVLGRRRVLYSVETAGAGLCWFARIPSVRRKKLTSRSQLLRPLVLREQNIAALWPFHHSSTGLLKGPYGPLPVRLFRTPSGQAYAFQFHVTEKKQSVGNYLLFAPTGGGKSTLLMHLLGGLSKFAGVRSYIFDSKEGARFMVEAMGGHYQGYEDLALNPLDVGDDTPVNRQRVYAVLRAIAGDVEVGEDVDAAFTHAVELAFKLQPPERTLNTIFEFAFAKRTALRRAFMPWVVDSKGTKGIRSHVFNAPHDSLGGLLSASHMVGINMNEALDDPSIGPPVVTHIAAAIGKSAAQNSSGFNIFIDEAAKLLQNEGFRLLAMEMYREYRKLDGCVGLAFQDPGALFRSGVADAFLENTATLIFLPNSQASRSSLERFNLNEEQIAFVLGTGERAEGERRALIVKRDAASGFDDSAIVDVNLGFLGEALRFYRAGTEANKHLADVKSQWGAEWQSRL